jgi:zinc D-Ala-D-Ala dipeptidase
MQVMSMLRTVVLSILLFCPGLLYADDRPLFNETHLAQHDLVDVQMLDSSIQVRLMYATPDNFLGKNVYGDFHKCYLRKDVALKLIYAQKMLTAKQKGYHLLVYDALRPRRIQYAMWDIVKGTPMQGYVANPHSGSIHNYGAAVDLTISDEQGVPLDMGTPFDYFGAKAQPRYESFFLAPELIVRQHLDAAVKKSIEDDLKKSGKLTASQVKNRRLLRAVMEQAGFINISNEWWHFNGYADDVVRSKYDIIE